MANMPLTDIGITPRKASQFASKGIETVTDLLGYYPTKYLDFRNPISFAEGKYHQGEHVAIKGKVVSGRVIDGKHYMLRLTDGNTFCTVFWFNQPFRTRQFSVGDVIALGGVVSWNEQYNNMTMATPDFVTTDIASAFSIQPVYRKIKGMSVEYLEDAIKLALPYTRECSAETLSLAQMRALRVPPIVEAIHMAHQPTDEKEIRLSRKRRAVDVLYPFCYELEAKKAEAAKVSFCRIKSTRDVLNKMQGVLPFKLTEDQKNAAEHMLTEMEHGERVDTLVQGDVGCGKTVVAEICALAMAMNGFQCAVMAPTVVLATQHYEEFSKILGSFGYKTVFLRSGMKAKEEKSVLAEIESGKAQIIVGTHSVISGKVKYHKLGLTIVDEEHRFGVEQRQALKQKAKGQIAGMQIRFDKGDKRYLWFSSAGFQGGCSARNIASYGIPGVMPECKKGQIVYVTEGALKAHIACELSESHDPYIALAGVNCFNQWETTCEYLKSQGITRVVDAFDSDRGSNEHVKNALAKLYEIASRYDIAMTRFNWGTTYKGVDDYYLAFKQGKVFRPFVPNITNTNETSGVKFVPFVPVKTA